MAARPEGRLLEGLPIATRTQPSWNLRGLSVIAFAHGASDFYSGAVPFLIFFVITRHGLSPIYQGLLGFLWYVTSSIVQPLFGYYTDRYGRWWFLPLGVAATVAAVSFAGTTNSLWVLAASIIIGGIGSAILHPEAGKYSAMLSGARKAGGISIFQIGGQVGFALGPICIATLVARYGGHGSLYLGIPGLLAVIALLVVMPRVHRSASLQHAQERAVSAASTAVDKYGVGLLVTATALRQLLAQSFTTFLPNLLTARGASLIEAGTIITGVLLVGGIGLLLGGYISDRFGSLTVSIAGLVAAVPFLFGFFLFPGATGLVMLLCANVLLAVQSAPGTSLVQAMLPRNLGMALGLVNGVAFGAGSAFVTAVGLGVARFGPVAALQAVSLLPLAGALCYVLVGPRIPAAVSARIAANTARGSPGD